MQFYMIDKDAAASAAALPSTAIRVNVREGWQILSDIGHHLGLSWAGQNKPYNVNHPTTMRLRESRVEFERFWSHYKAALRQYELRWGNITVWHTHIKSVPLHGIANKLQHADRWGTMAAYITTAKRKQLTDGEVARIVELSTR